MQIIWNPGRSLGNLATQQDPRQHWILHPEEFDPERIDKENPNSAAILAFLFSFELRDSFLAFRKEFEPGESPLIPAQLGSGRVVLFPAVKEAHLAEPDVTIVGFARFGLIGEMLGFLKGLKGNNTFYSSGVPIEGELAFAPYPPQPMVGDYTGPVHVIIDTEIAFANSRFLDDADHTRIAMFWDMGARIDPADPVVLGRYLNAARIEALRTSFDQSGNVDEWALYAQYDAGAYGPESRQRLPAASGHGTHVIDLFTGEPANTAGGHRDIPIVAVSLPQWAVDATHGFFLFWFVKLVYDWIETWPLDDLKPQVNFSFGGIAGPHDGTGALEQLFDTAINNGTVSAVSIPAGNSFDSYTHAAFTAADLAQPQSLEWNIQPDDGTESFLQIWLPECRSVDAEPNIQLSLMTPFGLQEIFLDNVYGVREMLLGSQALARVYLICQPFSLGGPPRSVFLVAVRHTDRDKTRFLFDRGFPDLAGGWTVTVSAKHLEPDHRVELWIERDDVLPRARTGARQSYFTAPKYVIPNGSPTHSKVTNAGTISDMATGEKTIVTAGYVRSMLQPSGYSGEGFEDPFRHPPTAAAIADDSRIFRGVLAAGTFSGSTTAMAGTSAASAIAARVVAGLVNGGVVPTRNAVKGVASAQDPRPFPDTKPINPVFGTYHDGLPPRSRVGWGCLKTGWTRMERFVPRT